MRKNLLLTLAFAVSALSASAQDKFENALDATLGDNTYEVTAADSIYWKYTSDKDQLIYVGGLNNTYDNAAVYVQKEGEALPTNESTVLKGVSLSGKQNVYPLMKGETAYVMVYNQGTVGFALSTKEVPGLGKGLSADNALPIELDTVQYLGNPYITGYSNKYDMYATYTASEDGVLYLTSKSYIGNCTVNGTALKWEYSKNVYDAKVSVENGQTYTLVFNDNQPFLFSAAMTHPTAGSLDLPFTLAEGENTVPAAYGTYYYTYTPTKTGYMNISSTEALAGGQVKIYSSKSNISYQSASASSNTGSFNVRAELAYVYSNSQYFVEVTKVEATDADQTFTFAMEDYKQGEKESNPIVISELPDTLTLATAAGKYYYSVTVPQGSAKFLTVKSTNAVTVNTSLYVYPSGKGQYYGKSSTGTGIVKYDATSDTQSADQTYIIFWNSSEESPIEFTVSLEDIVQGSTKSNPLTAVQGDNTVPGDGEWFYTYTATKDGKLSITGTPEMTVKFPYVNTDYGYEYEDEYAASVSGATYSIVATKDKAYTIQISGAKANDVFALAEEDLGAGESRSTAIEVDSVYTFDANPVNELWIKYTVKNNGNLEAGTEVPYNYSQTVEFGNIESENLDFIVTYDPVTYDSKYATTVRGVKAGEVYVMHLSLGGATFEGQKVYFREVAAAQGETLDNPFVLENVGDNVIVPEASRNAGQWVKVVAKGGDVKITTSGYAMSYWYGSLADAESMTNSKYIDTEYDEQTYETKAYTLAEAEAGDNYLYVNYSYGPVTLTLVKNGEETDGINALNAANAGTTEVYTLGGVKVANSTKKLAKGIYVVKNGKETKKVVVK